MARSFIFCMSHHLVTLHMFCVSYCDGSSSSSVCPPLEGGHCGIRVSVQLVCMGLHSVHVVCMGLGISGVKKSTSGDALNKEQFDPTSFSPENVRPTVCPSVKNFFENLFKKCDTFLSTPYLLNPLSEFHIILNIFAT